MRYNSSFFLVVFWSTMLLSGVEADAGKKAIKCGTPQILEDMSTGRMKIAAREVRQKSVLSNLGHFRVWYDTTGVNAPSLVDANHNSIPDYVDSTLAYCEYAWDIIINQLNFKPPLGDNGAGGGNEIDVYIKEFGGSIYGYTYVDNKLNGISSGYIIIDNNYAESGYTSKGYNGLRVTTAHEFFHVVQFGYSCNFALTWWMEHSSVWMEEKAWSNVNDYLAYISYFFNDMNNTSLNTSNGSYEYGAAIWAMYLGKKFGENVIKNIWERFYATGSTSITVFNDVIPLADAFSEFSAWNYFTDNRANTTDFYPDCDKFNNSVHIDMNEYESPAVDSLNTNYLTSRYVELFFIGQWGTHDVLKVSVLPRNLSQFVSRLILFNNPDDYRIHTISEDGENIPLEKTWAQGVLVSSCTNTSGSGYRYVYDTEIIPYTEVEETPLYAFVIHGAYPNPFNPSTTISFSLPQSGYVAVDVYNVTGQKVANLYEGIMDRGEKRLFWKADNLAGGIYFIHISTPNGSKTVKTLLMK